MIRFFLGNPVLTRFLVPMCSKYISNLPNGSVTGPRHTCRGIITLSMMDSLCRKPSMVRQHEWTDTLFDHDAYSRGHSYLFLHKLVDITDDPRSVCWLVCSKLGFDSNYLQKKKRNHQVLCRLAMPKHYKTSRGPQRKQPPHRLPVHPRTKEFQEEKLLVRQPQESYHPPTLCKNTRKSSFPHTVHLAIRAITGPGGPLAPRVYRPR